MAQTTDHGTFRAAVVKVAATDTAWANMTDISGSSAAVADGGGERSTGEQHTFTGDTPLVGAGKRASKDITVRYVYTETAAEASETVRAQYETAGGALCVKWAPRGAGDSDNFVWSTGVGIITAYKYPEGETGDGAITMGEFVVKCAEVSKTTIGSA